MRLFTFIFKLLSRRAAHRVIEGRPRDRLWPEIGRFTAEDVNQIISVAWRELVDNPHNVIQSQTSGSWIIVRLASLSIFAYKALIDAGVEREYTRELLSDVIWSLIHDAIRGPIAMFQLITPNRAKRLQRQIDLIMQRFPFNPQDYILKMKSTPQYSAFDVLRCPAIDQMLTLLPPDEARALCIATWCNQDYAAADLWGGALKRNRTLASGASHCDFIIFPTINQNVVIDQRI